MLFYAGALPGISLSKTNSVRSVASRNFELADVWSVREIFSADYDRQKL
jgi:hypothetical protein